jgi:hypothetical protein
MVPTAPLSSSSAAREEEADFQTPTKAKPQRNKRKLATSTGLEQQTPDVVLTANSFTR